MSSCCEGLLTENNPLEVAALFSTGLMMSAGHCVGMCGPIIAAFSARQRESLDAGAGPLATLGAQLTYHVGRVLSYCVIGALAGFLGSSTTWIDSGHLFQGSISLTAGILMLALAVGLLGLLPTQSWVESRTWTKRITCHISDLLRAKSPHQRFLLGMANGFLPCGPVVAVAIGAASSRDPVRGALVMALYGLGTIPALLFLGVGSSAISPRVRQRLVRGGGVLVLVIGIQLALRGAAALEWIPHARIRDLVIY